MSAHLGRLQVRLHAKEWPHSGIRDLGDNLDRGVSVKCSLFLPVPWLSGALGIGAVCADFHRQSKLRASVL